jgi:hypothetical protein
LNYASLIQAVKHVLEPGLRTQIMAVGPAVVGLVPILWSTSAGSEAVRPLAALVIGIVVSGVPHVGMITRVLVASLGRRESGLVLQPVPLAGPLSCREEVWRFLAHRCGWGWELLMASRRWALFVRDALVYGAVVVMVRLQP